MKPHLPFFGDQPAPEQWSAYLDGELDEEAARQVEAWLAEHPETAAELESERKLTALWQEAAPPEIDCAVANTVLANIERAVFGRTTRRARRRRAALRLAVAGLAATLLLVLWPKKPVDDPRPPDHAPVTEGKIDGARLVGAEPLLDQPLPLATPRDVQLLNLSPDEAGTMPVLARDRDPNAPALMTTFELVPLSSSDGPTRLR
jgi:hypothetical protein